jgi:hypothetical protein
MPIPELNEDGVLPVGIYDCTLDEIGERFGCFQTTDRRVYLFENLCALVNEERTAGIAIEMIINGSFVTDKPEPNDIDLLIVLPENYIHTATLPHFRYNAISKRKLRRQYRFDVFVVGKNSTEYHERLRFFQGTREEKEKGILRLVI